VLTHFPYPWELHKLRMWHGMLNQARSGQLPISAKIAFTDNSATGIAAIWGGLWCMTSRFTPAYANEHSLSFVGKIRR
jgi:hypothetical protein